VVIDSVAASNTTIATAALSTAITTRGQWFVFTGMIFPPAPVYLNLRQPVDKGISTFSVAVTWVMIDQHFQ
jgi:hypothetical protein